MKWVVAETWTAQALDLYARCSQNGQPIIAPALLPFEVTNILRQKMVRHGLAFEVAMDALERFRTFDLTLASTELIHESALQLAVRFGLAAAYDSHYLVLAQSVGCEFWTDDQRLLNALDDRLPFVRWIGDYKAGDPL